MTSRRGFLKYSLATVAGMLAGAEAHPTVHFYEQAPRDEFLLSETRGGSLRELRGLSRALAPRHDAFFDAIPRFDEGRILAEPHPSAPHLIHRVQLLPPNVLHHRDTLTAQALNPSGFFLTAFHAQHNSSPSDWYLMHDVHRGSYGLAEIVAGDAKHDILLCRANPFLAISYDTRLAPIESGQPRERVYQVGYPMDDAWKTKIREDIRASINLRELVEAYYDGELLVRHSATRPDANVRVVGGAVLDENLYNLETREGAIAVSFPLVRGESGSPFYDQLGNLMTLGTHNRWLLYDREHPERSVPRGMSRAPRPERLRMLLERTIAARSAHMS